MNREELFDKHLRGELSNEETAELKRLLASDAEAGRAFVEHVGETALFVRVGSQLQSTEMAENVVPIESPSLRLQEPLPRRRFPVRWQAAALAACLVALGVVAVLVNRPAPTSTALIEPQRSLEVQATGTDVRVTRDGLALDAKMTELQPGDIITASSNETAAIVYHSETTRLELQPGAMIVLGETAQGKRFELLRGIVSARVAMQPAGSPLRIKTAHARATVLGTEFLLRADEQSTRLDVLEGKVQLNCRVSGKKTIVKAGMAATVQAGKASFDVSPLCKSNCILRECRGPDAAAKLEKLSNEK